MTHDMRADRGPSIREGECALLLSGQLPSLLQSRYRHVLGALDGLTVGEQLEVTTQVIVGLLAAARLRAEPSYDALADFNLLCLAVEEWLAGRVALLRRPDPK